MSCERFSLRRIYLHIGLHKTGTTAIQRFCYLNRGWLKEKGVYYPENGILHVGHHALVQALYPEKIDWIELDRPKQEIIDSLRTEINAHPDHDLLFSAENFPRLKPAEVKRFFDWQRSIKIIVYLRPQEELVNSLYNQALKSKYETGTVSDFLQKLDTDRLLAELNFKNYLEPWEEVFGLNNLIVRRYDRSKGDIAFLQDFLGTLGISKTNGVRWPEGSSNPSLGPSAIAVLKLCNVHRPIDDKSYFIDILAALLDDYYPHGAPQLLSEDEINFIREKYEAVNKYVVKHYFKSAGERLFEYDSKRIEQSSIPSIGTTELAQFVVKLWNRLRTDIRQLQRERMELFEVAEKRLSEIRNLDDERNELMHVAEQRLDEIKHLVEERNELFQVAEQRLTEIRRLEEEQNKLLKVAERRFAKIRNKYYQYIAILKNRIADKIRK